MHKPSSKPPPQKRKLPTWAGEKCNKPFRQIFLPPPPSQMVNAQIQRPLFKKRLPSAFPSFQLQSSVLWYSIPARRITSAKGTIWQRTSQISIILISEVWGRLSILLIKIVVITNMVVRFTLKAASKKKGLKKVVAKVIAVRRREGKYVVIISLVIFLFITTTMLIPFFS